MGDDDSEDEDDKADSSESEGNLTDSSCSDHSDLEETSSSEDEDSSEQGSPSPLTADQPESPFYKEGIHNLANIVAGKHCAAYPYLKSSGPMIPSRDPAWVACHSKLGTVKASCAMVEMIKELDLIFLKQHGQEVDRERGVLERYKKFINVLMDENFLRYLYTLCRFRAKAAKKLPMIPVDVIDSFGRLRLTIRRKQIEEKIRLAKWKRKQEKNKNKDQKNRRKDISSSEDEQQHNKQSRKRRRTMIYKD